MTKTIRLLFIALLLFGHAVFATETKTEQAAKLVGWWKEYYPSSNLVQFTPDGTVRLMLRKGEIGDLHELVGTWEILDNQVIQMSFSANGKTLVRDAKLTVSDDSMTLTDENGGKTKHRRHSGKLPNEYVW
jgi:hypothetical protein